MAADATFFGGDIDEALRQERLRLNTVLHPPINATSRVLAQTEWHHAASFLQLQTRHLGDIRGRLFWKLDPQ